MAGDQHQPAALVEEALDALLGEIEDGLGIPVAIGGAAIVAEKYQGIPGQGGAQGGEDGQPAIPRIIDPDHCSLCSSWS